MTEQSEVHIASELVRRILDGDKQAESELVQRYERGLLFILRRQCNQDEALAQDLAQDTWSIVLTKVRNNELRDSTKLNAFIVQTAKFQAIGHFRKMENQKARFKPEDEEETPASGPSPESFLERYNLSLMVRQVILELEQLRDRELMFRFFIQQQEKQFICNELELDTQYFDKVLYRAKKRFGQLWQTFNDSS